MFTATPPDVSKIDEFAPLLKRVLFEPKNDLEAQKNLLLGVTAAWNKAKMPKGAIKEVFKALHEKANVLVEAFEAWKEDREKIPGKMKALLQTNSWIDSITPKEEDEGDEGDD